MCYIKKECHLLSSDKTVFNRDKKESFMFFDKIYRFTACLPLAAIACCSEVLCKLHEEWNCSCSDREARFYTSTNQQRHFCVFKKHLIHVCHTMTMRHKDKYFYLCLTVSCMSFQRIDNIHNSCKITVEISKTKKNEFFTSKCFLFEIVEGISLWGGWNFYFSKQSHKSTTSCCVHGSFYVFCVLWQ